MGTGAAECHCGRFGSFSLHERLIASYGADFRIVVEAHEYIALRGMFTRRVSHKMRVIDRNSAPPGIKAPRPMIHGGIGAAAGFTVAIHLQCR